ncbi:MAG: hypothetical protein ALECFALPRED_006756 [Alectoria fallacina]|uniref:Uncharacterized protein n=1 Tax=Alectoria fallacina TaxID=1903189 RepID=A0A8H3IQ78_9LECA|nr:MAG: hypothetical protein ALECFALPRED_006756 [Alectoria fallacina]
MNGTKAEAAVAGTLISQLSSLIKYFPTYYYYKDFAANMVCHRALEAHELFPSGWGDECPVVQSTAARDVVPKALLLTRVLCTRARSDLNELDLVALEEGGRSTVDEFRAIMDHIATIKSVTEEVKMLWFGVSAGGYLEITYDIKLLSIDWGEEAVGAAKAMALVF